MSSLIRNRRQPASDSGLDNSLFVVRFRVLSACEQKLVNISRCRTLRHDTTRVELGRNVQLALVMFAGAKLIFDNIRYT